MALAKDTTGGGRATSATSLTVSLTLAGTANSALWAFGFSNGGDFMTGVTWNGTPMILDRKQLASTSGQYIYSFYLPNPASGTHNLVFSTSSSTIIDGSAICLTGARQTGIPDAGTSNESTNTTITTNLTTLTDNCWTLLYSGGDRQPTASTGSTLENSQSDACLFSSNGAITPAGSTSMVITRAAGGSNAQIMVSVAPFVLSTFVPKIIII
jgi:hypothetical protein